LELAVHLPLMEFGDEGQSRGRLARAVDAARECDFAALSANDHFLFRTPCAISSASDPRRRRGADLTLRPGRMRARAPLAARRRAAANRARGEGIISSVLQGSDQRTRITPETREVLFAVYAPAGVGESAVVNIAAKVVVVAPQAEIGLPGNVHGGVTARAPYAQLTDA
jgi:hypothetical protein